MQYNPAKWCREIANEQLIAMFEAWQGKRREYHDSQRWQRAQTAAEWWDKYDRYLLTLEWRTKRDKVLERDEHLCQGCYSKRAITAHHLTYAHVGHELLFELIAVCAQCYIVLHPNRELIPSSARL